MGGLLALYRHKEILVNSALKAKKRMARAISKNQVSDPGPSWPSCSRIPTISVFDAMQLYPFQIQVPLSIMINFYNSTALNTQSCSCSFYVPAWIDRGIYFLALSVCSLVCLKKLLR